MDLAYIDMTANRGDSIVHRRPAISKFIFTLCIIGGVVMAEGPLELAFLLTVLGGGYFLARISIGKIIHYAFYPAFFSLIFALFQFSNSFSAGMTVIMKAVTAAMALLLLVFTTPYPSLFGLLSNFLPQIIVDGMFFTYRIFFIMISEVRNLLTNLKIKGGYHPFRLLTNLKNLAGAIGVLFIHAFELSERMYKILTIRGYNGRLSVGKKAKLDYPDYILILFGINVIIMVVLL